MYHMPYDDIAIDSRGKLWRDDRAIVDTDDGYDGAHIIEVLIQIVSDAFLTHLRKKGVSYLFDGKTELT
ncbi:Hypothetical protein LUCI_0148 [Lucifera butyrica]|uniref:Uncharacterized protein n=1 Tax=Lucifera butyrica TaxID=1351585 RepID=A0A498R3U5_9FIRM|nr:hypothetical protein [Lucifera butyrica]VBB04942.1 Hypothetical protein LUCI_0148 [Lucifera butyrica]